MCLLIITVVFVVIELLDYKISKTYTTDGKPQPNTISCYRTIRLQNFKDIHNARNYYYPDTYGCYRTIRLQNFKDIHNIQISEIETNAVVIELLDYKISKTYTTEVSIPLAAGKLL